MLKSDTPVAESSGIATGMKILEVDLTLIRSTHHWLSVFPPSRRFSAALNIV